MISHSPDILEIRDIWFDSIDLPVIRFEWVRVKWGIGRIRFFDLTEKQLVNVDVSRIRIGCSIQVSDKDKHIVQGTVHSVKRDKKLGRMVVFLSGADE